MDTPVLDFLRRYAAGDTARLHMPGHKGRGPLGCEKYDITEIAGADDLSAPEGIIAASENNASSLFGSRATFYSAGGSSQCVKAMLLLCARRSASRTVLAARNVHKSFMHACALLGLEPAWLYGGGASLCSCRITPGALREALDAAAGKPVAVYITSPDYLGGTQDVAALAETAHGYGVPLVVDNAHGAYLRFMEGGAHPLGLGADLCCDSAHKTLPVLTGGAYLHVGAGSAWDFEHGAREALGVFGSSSPSYLITASLDAANAALAGGWPEKARECAARLDSLRAALRGLGVPVAETDPLRLTIDAFAAGYTGFELAGRLRAARAEPEFADRDRLVMMFSPDNPPDAYGRVLAAFEGFVRRAPFAPLPAPPEGERVMSPREALLCARRRVPADEAVGCVCASAAVACPPAVPIAVMGERIGRGHAELMREYGVAYAEICVT